MLNNGFEHIDNVDLYLSSIEKYRPLNAKDELEIGRKIIEGDGTEMDKLITSNLKFVVNIAKQYRGCGVPFDELIAEGNMGLMTAAMRYDPSKGCKFITYAVYWIKSYIAKCIEDNVKEASSTSDVYDSLREKKSDIDNEELVLGDISTKVAVKDLTSCLKEREMEMLSMYFGLNGEEESSYKEIGERFGVTSECARQTVNASITKMKMNAVCNEHFNEYKKIVER